MKDILLKARQAFQAFKLINHKRDYNSEVTAIETAFNYAEENEQKLSNLEEENRQLKTKNIVAKPQFVKIRDRRFRLDSIQNYYVAKEIDDYSTYQYPTAKWYIRINNFGYQCESEKEAVDYVKMLDELLGVK